MVANSIDWTFIKKYLNKKILKKYLIEKFKILFLITVKQTKIKRSVSSSFLHENIASSLSCLRPNHQLIEDWKFEKIYANR